MLSHGAGIRRVAIVIRDDEVWTDIPYKIYMGVRTLERLSSSEETNLTPVGVSYRWRHETGKKEGAD